MASLPTYLHSFSARDAAGLTAPTSLPQNGKIPGQGLANPPFPTPRKFESSPGGPWGLCGRCASWEFPWWFFSWSWAAKLDISLRSTIRWLQHHKQGQGERSKEEGVLWKVRESQVSPLGCSPSVLDTSLLARTNTSSAQLFHIDSAMHHAAPFAAGCVRAQHALGSGVPRCSMHGCAHTAHVHARHARIIHAWFCQWFCTNLGKYRMQAFKFGSPPEVTRTWRIHRWCITWGRALAALHVHMSIKLIYCWATTSSSIKNKQMFFGKQHRNEISKPDWGMQTWHPMWLPATSLSLGGKRFSTHKIKVFHTRRIAFKRKNVEFLEATG